MEDEPEEEAIDEPDEEQEGDTVIEELIVSIAELDGRALTVGSAVFVALNVAERVVREVAELVRVPAVDLEPIGEPVPVREVVTDSVGDVDGDPDTVSATDGVVDRELMTVFVSLGELVDVRVVLIERELVPDAVGETVSRVVPEAVVEADELTVGSTVPVGVSD